MTAAKFSPGPWRAIANEGAIHIVADNPYGRGPMHVADVRGWGHLVGAGGANLMQDVASAILDANARLIAAAPEMHELLDWLRRMDRKEEVPRESIAALLARIDGQPDQAVTP